MLRPRRVAAAITTTKDIEMKPLRDARIKARLTALALAEGADSKEGRIYNFERGRHNPRPDEARRICAVLGVEPEVIFPELFGKGGR